VHTTSTSNIPIWLNVLSFGFLSIRSLTNKLDDLLEVGRDIALDVLCLVETWHDVDSVNFIRLRTSGYQVVDRQRPRAADDLSLSTNYGGVALVASLGIQLSPFNIAVSPTSFEFTAARLVQSSFAAVIVVIYRPGSHAVQASFFDEFAAIMDCDAPHQERVFVVGDVNIRCDRPDEQFSSSISSPVMVLVISNQTRHTSQVERLTLL